MKETIFSHVNSEQDIEIVFKKFCLEVKKILKLNEEKTRKEQKKYEKAKNEQKREQAII